MMLSALPCYTTIIQLITAINFAYIIAHLPQDVYDKIFRQSYRIKDEFDKYQTKLEIVKADAKRRVAHILANESNETVSTTAEITVEITTSTDSAQVQPEAIRNLDKAIEKLELEWGKKKAEAEQRLISLKEVKGFKSLFLMVSLFCICDLLFIATYSAFPDDFFFTAYFTTCLLAIAFTVYISWIIFQRKWDDKPDDACYRFTLAWFITGLFIAFIVAGENHVITSYKGCNPFQDWVEPFMFLTSVALPFVPIILAVLYVLAAIEKERDEWIAINNQFNDQLDNFTKQLAALDKPAPPSTTSTTTPPADTDVTTVPSATSYATVTSETEDVSTTDGAAEPDDNPDPMSFA